MSEAKQIEITEAVARKCLLTVDAGLVAGLGKPEPGKMCVEAAINYALGLPHGDNPSCVDPALRSFKIRLNDSRWSSDRVRATGMRRLALAQLGSAGTLDQKAFVAGLVKLSIGKWLPQALRAAAARCPSHSNALLASAVACETYPTYDNALKARCAAGYAADAADAAGYDADAAGYAAYAAAGSAADAAGYAADAADAAGYAADAAACAAAAAAHKDDKLSAAAEDVVQLLIALKVPGTQWLYLTEES